MSRVVTRAEKHRQITGTTICQECRKPWPCDYEQGRADGYARGLIEGDSGGRKEGYRAGYAAGKDAVMTASYAQAVAQGQRDERESLPDDSVAEGVRLLQTIGLDITYTDEGLEVIARQIMRLGHAEARRAVDDDLDRYLAECDVAGIAAKDLVVVTFQRALAAIDALTTRGKEGNRG